MITTILTVEKLKQLWLEVFINKTNKVTDISDNSVLNATAYGAAKVGQKCMKDIAIVESHIFPESASGVYLDRSATLFGAPERITTAIGSSTYLRVVGVSGTFYEAGVNFFNNYNGIQFELESDFTISSLGWGYVKVKSTDSGSKTNAEPNSIVNVSPAPVGHIGCTNEYYAIGGVDIESDELFRLRIKKHLNIMSRSTISYLEQILQGLNPDILKIYNLGNNEESKRVIGIVLQSGGSLDSNQLNSLLVQATPYFPITDLNQYGDAIGIKFEMVLWEEIDIDFRVQINPAHDPNEVRKQIQINLTKYLDFRFWDRTMKVEWDNLLQAVKSTEGVRYVPDIHFTPSVDKIVRMNRLPRVKGFIMRNEAGSIIPDQSNVLLPIFYPVQK